MKVKDIMTKEVVTVLETNTLQEVSRIFFEKSISGAPVIDSAGKVVGMISDSDIVRSVKPYEERLKMIYPSLSFMSVTFSKDSEEKAIADVVREVQQIPVKEIMTRKVHSVLPDDPISKAVMMINEKKVNRLPVIAKSKLVGILTRADILRCLALVDLSILES